MLCINTEKIVSLSRVLSKPGRVVIVTHKRPDGDALGSAAAFHHYLASIPGCDVTLLNCESVSRNLAFICEGVKMSTDASLLDSCDLLVITDMRSLHRNPDYEEAMRACKAYRIVVDHHPGTDTEKVDLLFSYPEASSSCEVLFWILRAICGGDLSLIPKASLECMMAGMTTDTNNFANSTTADTLRMASELLEAGVDRDSIVGRLFNSCRENRVRAISGILSDNLVIKGGLAYMLIRKSDILKYGIEDGELEGLVNIPLEIDSVRMSVTLKEEDDCFRVSARSKKPLKVNVMMSESFHGGGHDQAAGGRLEVGVDVGSAEEICEYLERSAARFVQLQPLV